MKVKVLVKFQDKYTGEVHKADKVMNISKDRFEEILTVGPFVEEVVEPTKEVVEPAKTKGKKKASK